MIFKKLYICPKINHCWTKMANVSNRLAVLNTSQTLMISQKVREMQAQGVEVISLSVGEPDIDTPDYVKEAAKAAIENNFTFYPPVEGFADLRESISRKFSRENKLDYSADQIVVSNGSKQSIANVMLCLLNPGDEVLIPTPYWVSYPELAKLAEAKPVYIPTTIEEDYKVTPDQIVRALTPRTKMFVFSSPSNPAGSVYTYDELKEIAKIFAKNKQIFVVSDELYEHINFAGKHESIAQFDDIKEQVITVNGVSKGYAMTGWRIGYIGAPKWLADACSKLQGQYTSGACSIAQKAAKAAIDSGSGFSEMISHEYMKRRDFMIEKLSEIEGVKMNVPQGAFYIFPNFSAYLGCEFEGKKIKSATDLSSFLLEHAEVAVIGGDSFGQQECLRFSYALPEEKIAIAINRIKGALAQLK